MARKRTGKTRTAHRAGRKPAVVGRADGGVKRGTTSGVGEPENRTRGTDGARSLVKSGRGVVRSSKATGGGAGQGGSRKAGAGGRGTRGAGAVAGPVRPARPPRGGGVRWVAGGSPSTTGRAKSAKGRSAEASKGRKSIPPLPAPRPSGKLTPKGKSGPARNASHARKGAGRSSSESPGTPKKGGRASPVAPKRPGRKSSQVRTGARGASGSTRRTGKAKRPGVTPTTAPGAGRRNSGARKRKSAAPRPTKKPAPVSKRKSGAPGSTKGAPKRRKPRARKGEQRPSKATLLELELAQATGERAKVTFASGDAAFRAKDALPGIHFPEQSWFRSGAQFLGYMEGRPGASRVLSVEGWKVQHDHASRKDEIKRSPEAASARERISTLPVVQESNPSDRGQLVTDLFDAWAECEDDGAFVEVEIDYEPGT
jgi:hypothetical protein